MAQQQICIVGAGISGLVLGRCLLSRGIRPVLYERDKSALRHGYGITLKSSAYRPLLPVLDLDEDAFKRKVAVDAAIGGQGCEQQQDANDASFRANRAKFEELLREGLDVHWEYRISDAKSTGNRLSLEFENGQKFDAQTVIGAEGVHSPLRKIFCPNTNVNILPFAVINGKRRLNPDTFDRKYAPYMDNENKLSHKISDALLQISVNERSNDKASVSYTYSRPARQSNDPLFRPNRSIPGASDIPEEFYTEVDALGNLDEPFKEVFNSNAMKEDRLLNWLMRSVDIEQSELEAAAEKGVVFLGDSAHHGPILGSDGANEAITDAIELANCLANDGERSQLKGFVTSRYAEWTKYVEENEARLAEMHGASKANL